MIQAAQASQVAQGSQASQVAEAPMTMENGPILQGFQFPNSETAQNMASSLLSGIHPPGLRMGLQFGSHLLVVAENPLPRGCLQERMSWYEQNQAVRHGPDRPADWQDWLDYSDAIEGLLYIRGQKSKLSHTHAAIALPNQDMQSLSLWQFAESISRQWETRLERQCHMKEFIGWYLKANPEIPEEMWPDLEEDSFMWSATLKYADSAVAGHPESAKRVLHNVIDTPRRCYRCTSAKRFRMSDTESSQSSSD